MGKYKVCGFCGKKNPISEGICSCNNLLINCTVFDEETDETYLSKTTEDDSPMLDAINGKRFKKCPDCGYLNRPYLPCCENCGESLDDVFDLVEKSDNEPLVSSVQLSPFYFISTGGFRYNLPIGEYIIGRDEQMGEDITNLNRMYVSSKHFAVKCNSKSVEIADISKNGTFLNKEKLPRGQFIPLTSGAILGLGGITEEVDPHGYYITLV